MFGVVLDEISFKARATLQWFHHNAAPVRNQISVRNYLPEMFANSYIAINVPVAWLPRSPHFSMSDSFLWGTLKNRKYQNTYDTVEEFLIAVYSAILDLDKQSVRKQLILS